MDLMQGIYGRRSIRKYKEDHRGFACFNTTTPNFEDQSSLIDTIDKGVEKL